MTADGLHQRVDEIFFQAIERPADQREKFVEAAARDDPAEVRQMVMQLIAADERADTNFAARSPLNLRNFTAENIHDPRIGLQIDDYVIQSRIASGGFGTVYHATRQTPYQEGVAIKLLHRDNLAAASDVQRVLREMQALSDLRHPNIVSQLHSNVTSDGEPYIVMEFIDGLQLDTYCNANQLSINERLKLFQSVCEAVHFAHSHGWVHRDLKPSNILVTAHGIPKLLDFGIAKLTDANSHRFEQRQTITQGPVGTPQYMSPEQFLGQTAGPATDIYALGAILYELISGHRAFDVMCRGIDAILLEAVQTAIKETIPSRPSTLVVSNELTATGVSKQKVADQRRSNPTSLKRCLEGDVDNIAMMALRKEPSRRYASAAAVSEDIQRWLDHRPVSARPDSIAYRTSKFVRRNRTMLAVGAVVAACLVVALMTLQRGQRAVASRDTERAQRFIESAQPWIDDDDIPQAMLQLHAAYEAAPQDSPWRAACARLLAGWSRYLGQPLDSRSNLRYTFSDQSERLAVIHAGGAVAIWDTASMQKSTTFEAGGKVRCHAFSPDAKQLLTVSDEGLARIWNAESGRMLFEQRTDGLVFAARVLHDKALLLELMHRKVRLLLWEFEQSNLRELAARDTEDKIINVEFVNDQQLVVALKSGDSRRVELWKVESLSNTMNIVAAATGIGPCEFAAGANFYRNGSISNSVVVDIHTREVVDDLPGKVMSVNGTGQFLLKRGRKIGVSSASKKAIHEGNEFTGRWDATFCSDARILVADLRPLPRLHTVVTSNPLAKSEQVQGHRLFHPFFSSQSHVSDRSEFGPLGRYVVFDNRCDDNVSATRVPWIWSINPFLVATVPNHKLDSPIRCMALAEDWLVTVTTDSVRCWDGVVWRQRQFVSANLTALALAADARIVVVGDSSGSVHYLDLPGLQQVKSVSLAAGQAIRSLSISSDATKLLVATQNEACVFSESAPPNANSTAKQLTVATRRNSAIDRAKLESMGKSFAVASREDVRSYDLITSRSNHSHLLDLSNASGRIDDFVFTNESAVAATIQDGKVVLLGRNGEQSPLGNRMDGECVSLRADGHVVVVGHADGTLRFWDSQARRPLSKELRAGRHAIRKLSFNTEGTRLASATESGELKVWDSAFRPLASEDKLDQAIEVLTGYDLQTSGSATASTLSKSEWDQAYESLQNGNR